VIVVLVPEACEREKGGVIMPKNALDNPNRKAPWTTIFSSRWTEEEKEEARKKIEKKK